MARFFWHARQVEPMSTFIRISTHYYYYGTPTCFCSLPSLRLIWSSYQTFMYMKCVCVHVCEFVWNKSCTGKTYLSSIENGKHIQRESYLFIFCTKQYTPESIAHFSYRQESKKNLITQESIWNPPKLLGATDVAAAFISARPPPLSLFFFSRVLCVLSIFRWSIAYVSLWAKYKYRFAHGMTQRSSSTELQNSSRYIFGVVFA